MSALRTLLRDNIADVVDVFDEHNSEIYNDGTYRCTCGGSHGTKDQWEQHLADRLAGLLEGKATQLELFQ